MRPVATLTGLAALAFSLAAPVAGAHPATTNHAAQAPASRDWTVWVEANRAWQPPAKTIDALPATEGSMVGLRFAAHATADPRTPRIMPTFDDVCGSVAPVDGNVRTAVVVDFGRQADAPPNSAPNKVSYTCATVTNNTTVKDLLANTIKARLEQNTVCAVDMYPAGTGCRESLPALSAQAAALDEVLAPAELPAPPEAVSVADAAAMNQATNGAGSSRVTPTESTSAAPKILIALGGVGVLAAAAIVFWRVRQG